MLSYLWVLNFNMLRLYSLVLDQQTDVKLGVNPWKSEDLMNVLIFSLTSNTKRILSLVEFKQKEQK